MIRVGTAGWSYPDWEGIVYPKGTANSRESLEHLARMFEVLEINMTFYRPPSARMAESWVRRVSLRPKFVFTAKLWQGFTHRRDESHEKEEKAFRAGLRPLVDAGRLGALLAQFPHSFKNTADNRAYLDRLAERFRDYPVVVEVRHASWLREAGREEFLAGLRQRGLGFCNVDQPRVGNTIPPTDLMGEGPGYLRLHGRNRADWFRKDAGRDARYNYLYSHEEIEDWIGRIRAMQGRGAGKDIFIIANNHYRGQAVANALEIGHLLDGRRVKTPATLVSAYPRLAPIVEKAESQGMLPL